MTDPAKAISRETRQNAQANILRAPKFKVDEQQVTRDWSLFFFFRILSAAEFYETLKRVDAASKNETDAAKEALWRDFAHPAILNAGLLEQRLFDKARGLSPAEPGGAADGAAISPPEEPDAPADAFLNWLKAIVSANKSGIEDTANLLLKALQSAPGQTDRVAAVGGAQSSTRPPNTKLDDPNLWIQQQFELESLNIGLLREFIDTYTQPEEFAALLQSMAGKVGPVVPEGPLGPLPLVTLYEILRQCAPAMKKPATDAGNPSSGIVRGEAADDVNAADRDGTPINIAFTYSGLAALKIDPVTLASFPLSFKQGMAARAQQLHDTGPSAPDYWEGELGLPSVHGYFTGGFALGDSNSASEVFWKAMRRDVRAFNDPVDERGQMLRFGFRMLFRMFGLEVLHIELGQDPYDVKDGKAEKLKYRYEHFGFRDGLSQPFVDMGLRDTLPGGGTPSRDHTWSPVAPGEIFLNMKDEAGEIQSLPVSREITVGSTFLVFRKLEQDVAGFRGFFNERRPDDPAARDALAAQFVGRWPDGMPLVLSPDQQRVVGKDAEATLNDFRYAADDPLGAKCPLGAHIRRANPRDIGGRGEARHHRILRRGISYGGPRLKPEVKDDGEKRGLLFIAANARIDLQFELIQSNWINGGEFLGQAGLGRCPLIGDHNGASSDSFLEAGASAPVTGLSRFVTTRGGDYFFAPGIEPLRKMADKYRFAPDRDIPYAGYSMGDVQTPSLIDHDRLTRYGKSILVGKPPLVRVSLPPSPGGQSTKVCFIAQYDDVKDVLSNPVTPSDDLVYSVRQYTDNGRQITRGEEIIVGTEDAGPTKKTRDRLHNVLYWGWETLEKARASTQPPQNLSKIVESLSRSACEAALRRTALERRIDLVSDLACQATTAIITDLYGIPTPDFLTEMAPALKFAHQHIGSLPPEWLATLVDQQPDNPGLATLQLWSSLILADLIGNIESNQALHALARQAGSEMLNYLDSVISTARALPGRAAMTLLGAFIENEKLPGVPKLYPSAGSNWPSCYYRDVGTILLEIVGTTMASTPQAFASVMGGLLKFGLDLPTLVRMKIPGKKDVLSQIIYEADRLNPTIAARIRYCETQPPGPLPSGAQINQGEWVVSLIQAANVDFRAFPDEPLRFKLDRDVDKYLLFNEQTNRRRCWGRDRVAMIVLKECLKAASRLQGLRKVAGKGGELGKLLGSVTINLPARFTRISDEVFPASEPGLCAHAATRGTSKGTMPN